MRAFHDKVVGKDVAEQHDPSRQRARADIKRYVPDHIDGSHDGRVVEEHELAIRESSQEGRRLDQWLRVRQEYEPRHKDGPDAGQVDVLVDFVIVVRQVERHLLFQVETVSREAHC